MFKWKSDDYYTFSKMDKINLSLRTSSYDDVDETIDVGKYDFPKEMWYMLPKWEVIVKTSTFVPVILMGILGNAILLNIIIRNRALRTPTNYLIANMAAADIIAVCVCPIMFMYHDFYQNYQLGAAGCKFEGFLEGALLITGVLNLCAVSYDRLTAIVMPLENRLTVGGTKIVMICTWLVGFLLATPLAIYRTYTERQWKNFLESYCSENPNILPMYWHVLIGALVWLPLCVMIICYSTIFHKLDSYEKKVLKREHPISVSYKMKVAKMLFIIVLTFVVLRAPFTTLVFIRNKMLGDAYENQVLGSFSILWYSSHYLIFLNAAINPVIYGLTNDNFRRAYHQTPFTPAICRKTSVLLSGKNKNKSKQNGKFTTHNDHICQKNEHNDMFANMKSLFVSQDKTKDSQLTVITKIKAFDDIEKDLIEANQRNERLTNNSKTNQENTTETDNYI